MSPLGYVVALALALSVAAGAPSASASASDADELARFQSGILPAASPLASGGALVALSVEVDASGKVSGIEDILTEDPFAGVVRDAVSGWRFRPATADGRPVESHVLITAVFGTPALAGTNPLAPDTPTPVRGGAAGPLPVAVPEVAIMPDFPPSAFVAGTVLVEVDIDRRGDVNAARLSASSPGLDEAALAAAKRWKFVPAERDGHNVPTIGYIAFAFRQPITSTKRP